MAVNLCITVIFSSTPAHTHHTQSTPRSVAVVVSGGVVRSLWEFGAHINGLWSSTRLLHLTLRAYGISPTFRHHGSPYPIPCSRPSLGPNHEKPIIQKKSKISKSWIRLIRFAQGVSRAKKCSETRLWGLGSSSTPSSRRVPKRSHWSSWIVVKPWNVDMKKKHNFEKSWNFQIFYFDDFFDWSAFLRFRTL